MKKSFANHFLNLRQNLNCDDSGREKMNDKRIEISDLKSSSEKSLSTSRSSKIHVRNNTKQREESMIKASVKKSDLIFFLN